MPLLRFRVTGTEDDLRLLADRINDIDGIEHIEEIADLMPHMDDPDSSSAGLTDDIGPGTHLLEIDAPDDALAERVRNVIELTAANRDLVIEFEADDG
ncbi:hypothetical protein CSC70_04715 [Pseudoxanthomonas kalamensis DSM 18571]|uniref:hypothetical protein n=1 Tax=Pseudoxanthomonas kalamensis TaxID=289483 RepID=UPI0013909600|nr:hypothetical protein [Pseudoxanthomonas kalamensis]KAF1711221.1 hypothetical protein CSC70_04715 [Pseudoxanthomonas kalamensis DSM 18571]